MMDVDRFEFQAEDHAWYEVDLRFDGGEFTIRYTDINEEELKFSAMDFCNLSQLSLFTKRFRPISIQMQDSQCWKVEEGVRLCCAYQVDEDLRFYDAIVEQVQRSAHDISKTCTCSFYVRWLEGPSSMSWETFSTKVSQLCWLNPDQSRRHPALQAFIKSSVTRLRRSRIQDDARKRKFDL